MKNYLVEVVYQGKIHEPFGLYHKTTIEKVIESLKEEIDSTGYTEEYNGGLKFISPKNESYWMIYEYKE